MTLSNGLAGLDDGVAELLICASSGREAGDTCLYW
jgi:hypothetical protein